MQSFEIVKSVVSCRVRDINICMLFISVDRTAVTRYQPECKCLREGKAARHLSRASLSVAVFLSFPDLRLAAMLENVRILNKGHLGCFLMTLMTHKYGR